MRALKANSQGAPSVAEMSAQLNSNIEIIRASQVTELHLIPFLLQAAI